ncbi:hypothetical protein Syun_007898 [Stephania yunnanensis]|uniref:F-actin-capping protein subunit alpha n=1 Tax=Stephania yunnanensis TaxID=152371 RepID=A0AAP0PYX7_9MAGN
MSEEDQLEEEEEEAEEEELSDEQKKEIAKWFLTHAPAGEIQYVAKDVRSLLFNEIVYGMAAEEAFPLYNKAHMVSLPMPNSSGDVLITTFGELSENEYLDPRTAQVATVDHVKQVCTNVRPATDEELPSSYIEDFRGVEPTVSYDAVFSYGFSMLFHSYVGSCPLDAEIIKYVGEAYPKGVCAVYCSKGKDVEGPGSDFELAVVISAARHSPQNFCNGSWRSIWKIKFNDEMRTMELTGSMQVGAHYFEEGNVQLDANHECKDSTAFQAPDDCAISIASIISHHENEYLASLEGSYSNLPDTTFKDLRRKLPVTRTLFPWHNTLQLSLNRDITKELGTGK